jgi:hypothetical protein
MDPKRSFPKLEAISLFASSSSQCYPSRRLSSECFPTNFKEWMAYEAACIVHTVAAADNAEQAHKLELSSSRLKSNVKRRS